MGGVAEMGTQVSLAGSDRKVTKIEIGLGYPTGDRNIHTRIFANDGPGGAPGTQIWASPWIAMPWGRGMVVQAFDVPLVTVPRTYFITVV
jgi:hypothetical protein